MGEKEEIKNDGEKKAAEGGEKKVPEGGEMKAVEPITVVLKMDLHCKGCAKKVRRSISHFEGVKEVEVDCATNKLTVRCNVDPTWLRERVESKTKKKVDLVSPRPKKEAATITGGDGGNKPDEEVEKKEAAKKDDKEPKEPAVITVLMKIRLHCDGCAQKIKRIILKNIEGVNTVDTSLENNLVMVIGTMDVKELTTYLKEKLRSVEIIPQKKDDGDEKAREGGEEKKEKCHEDGVDGDTKEKEKETGGKKKEGETKLTGSIGEGTKGVEDMKVLEINKLATHTFKPQTHYTVPIYSQNYVENHQDHAMQMYRNQLDPSSSTGHVVESPHGHESSSNTGYMIPYLQGPPQPGYMSYYTMGPPPSPPPTYLNINDQTFSDENPDGCSVM